MKPAPKRVCVLQPATEPQARSIGGQLAKLGLLKPVPPSVAAIRPAEPTTVATGADVCAYVTAPLRALSRCTCAGRTRDQPRYRASVTAVVRGVWLWLFPESVDADDAAGMRGAPLSFFHLSALEVISRDACSVQLAVRPPDNDRQATPTFPAGHTEVALLFTADGSAAVFEGAVTAGAGLAPQPRPAAAQAPLLYPPVALPAPTVKQVVPPATDFTLLPPPTKVTAAKRPKWIESQRRRDDFGPLTPSVHRPTGVVLSVRSSADLEARLVSVRGADDDDTRDAALISARRLLRRVTRNPFLQTVHDMFASEIPPFVPEASTNPHAWCIAVAPFALGTPDRSVRDSPDSPEVYVRLSDALVPSISKRPCGDKGLDQRNAARLAAELTVALAMTHTSGVVCGPLAPSRLFAVRHSAVAGPELRRTASHVGGTAEYHVVLSGVGVSPALWGLQRQHITTLLALSPLYIRGSVSGAATWTAADDWWSLAALYFFLRTHRPLLDHTTPLRDGMSLTEINSAVNAVVAAALGDWRAKVQESLDWARAASVGPKTCAGSPPRVRKQETPAVLTPEDFDFLERLLQLTPPESPSVSEARASPSPARTFAKTDTAMTDGSLVFREESRDTAAAHDDGEEEPEPYFTDSDDESITFTPCEGPRSPSRRAQRSVSRVRNAGTALVQRIMDSRLFLASVVDPARPGSRSASPMLHASPARRGGAAMDSRASSVAFREELTVDWVAVYERRKPFALACSVPLPIPPRKGSSRGPGSSAPQTRESSMARQPSTTTRQSSATRDASASRQVSGARCSSLQRRTTSLRVTSGTATPMSSHGSVLNFPSRASSLRPGVSLHTPAPNLDRTVRGLSPQRRTTPLAQPPKCAATPTRKAVTPTPWQRSSPTVRSSTPAANGRACSPAPRETPGRVSAVVSRAATPARPVTSRATSPAPSRPAPTARTPVYSTPGRVTPGRGATPGRVTPGQPTPVRTTPSRTPVALGRATTPVSTLRSPGPRRGLSPATPTPNRSVRGASPGVSRTTPSRGFSPGPSRATAAPPQRLQMLRQRGAPVSPRPQVHRDPVVPDAAATAAWDAVASTAV